MIRLNRYLAQGSGISRRAADDAIETGRVSVDGKVAHLTTVLEAGQTVTFDGKEIAEPATFSYILLNKPAGYVCSRTKQGTAETIYALLPESLHGLKSVGRLDRESSGLLLLSDDGDFIHRRLHPSFKKLKRYEVRLATVLKPDDRAKLETGVTLNDGTSRLGIERVKERYVTVTLEEGRNRQIRRSFAALGYQVKRLHRTDFGPFGLGGLASGSYRSLSPSEIKI